MIKIFRKIRQQLLTENKISKYLIYAIGEILLVVIGIVIALQFNAWNTNRLTKIEVQSILKNLHEEFLQNKNSIESVINMNELCVSNSKTLIELIGQERDSLKKINMDSLLSVAFTGDMFVSSQNSLNDLVQSGRLGLLKNDSLKKLLFLWSGAYEGIIKDSERNNLQIDTQLNNYLNNFYPFKNIDVYSEFKWEKKSNLKIDKFYIFYDIKFENHLHTFIYNQSRYLIDLTDLKGLIDNILLETNTEKLPSVGG